MALTASADTLVLSDFENEQDLARFSKRNGVAQFATTTDHVASGERAARLVFTKWKSGAEQWPAVILQMSNDLPRNWSGHDILALTVHNESKADFDLGVYLADTAHQSTSQHFIIPPGKTETLRYRLDGLSIKVTSIREVHLFTTRPPEELSIVVDHLRLEEDIEPRLSALAEKLAVLRPEARSLGLTALLDECEATKREILTRTVTGPEARAALRAEIASLEDRVRLNIPRAFCEARMRSAFREIEPESPYACGFATGMEKIFPKDVPFSERVSRSYDIEMAGNEVESFQVLILAGDQALDDVQVSVSPLRRADGVTVVKTPTSQVSPVGFVETKRPPYQVNYVGWHPDPILDFLSSVDVRAGEMQPVWIRIKAPAGTPAGEYCGEITIRPANAPSVKLGLRVKVWGFDVPTETHLRTALSLRELMIAQVYGGVCTREMWNKYCDYMLEYRLNPDNIYALDTPPLADILRWCSKGANAYNLIYAMKPADLKPNAPYPEDRKQHIMSQLEAIVPKLKEHGVYDKAYLYGFDEVHPDSHNAMKDIFSTIKAKYPDLPILTTAYEDTFGEASGLDDVDCWVPLTPKFNLERVEKARARGKEVWWYICIVPKAPYANWLVEYDAIDTRSLMGLQTAKYQPDGFLYYAINRWPLSKKPITEGPYTDWNPASFYDNNGDGSFLCAGPDGPLATVRMENIRDGIEDNEYFWLLRREIERLKATPGPEAYHALRQAEKAVRIGDDLVKNLQSFSKDPQAIYAKRRQVAEAILAARKIK